MEINIITAVVAKALKAIYDADRANVYINPKDVTFILKVRTPAFENEFWKFVPTDRTSTEQLPDGTIVEAPITLVTLKKYGKFDSQGRIINDGASWAPDRPKGVKPGVALHDPGYWSLEEIAACWYKALYNPGPLFKRDRIAKISSILEDGETWTEADVRQLLDSMFGATITKTGGKRYVRRLYFSAVRGIGGIFHAIGGSKAAKVLLVCAMASIVGGCNLSCMDAPDIVEFPDGPPELQQIESGDVSGTVGDIFNEVVIP